MFIMRHSRKQNCHVQIICSNHVEIFVGCCLNNLDTKGLQKKMNMMNKGTCVSSISAKTKQFVTPCEGHAETLFTTGAFLIALSSGELRQIAGPEFKLLDSRIRETRLPRLTGGKVLMLHLDDNFLLAVQATCCNVFLRQEKFVQNTSRNVKFGQRAVAASMCEVAGELCLYVFLTSGHLELFALPSLHPLASLPVRLPSAMGPEAVNLCSDGSCCIRSGSTSSVWLTSALETCDAVALERSVRSATLAQLIQGLQNTVTGQ